MSALVCTLAPRGSWAAQYDRFLADGTDGADGIIQATDAQAWIASTGDWAPGGAAALQRWPQLHCSLFRLAAILPEAAQTIVSDNATSSPNATELERMEQQLRGLKTRLHNTLHAELGVVLGAPEMRKRCMEGAVQMWQVLHALGEQPSPDAIPDLCAAALYYLGSFVRGQLVALIMPPPW